MGFGAIWLVFGSFLPAMFGTVQPVCSYLHEYVLWFAAMPAFIAIFYLCVLAGVGGCNLAGRR